MLVNASPFQQDQSLVFGHVPQTGQQSVQQELSLKQLASNSITVHATGHIAARENAAFLANGTCAGNAKHSANPELTPDRSLTGEKTNLEASVDAIMAQELKEFATGRKDPKRQVPMVPPAEAKCCSSDCSPLPIATATDSHANTTSRSASQDGVEKPQTLGSPSWKIHAIASAPPNPADGALRTTPPQIWPSKTGPAKTGELGSSQPPCSKRIADRLQGSSGAEVATNAISSQSALESQTFSRAPSESSPFQSSPAEDLRKHHALKRLEDQSAASPVSRESPFSSSKAAIMPATNSQSAFSASQPPVQVAESSSTMPEAQNPSKLPNPFAAAREQGYNNEHRASNPMSEAQASDSPFANFASPSCAPASSPKSAIKAPSPFQRNSYQEAAIDKPADDLVKREAARLSASISSSTHAPSVSDVSRAILTHNSSSQEVSQSEADLSKALTKSIGMESRKASRMPSLETVNENAVSTSGGPLDQIEQIINPVIAQLRDSDHSQSLADMTQGENSGMPSKRGIGMKSMSILETEGVPQLKHKSSTGAASDTDSPAFRTNLAHEGVSHHHQPVLDKLGIGPRFSVTGIATRARTVPTSEFHSLLADIDPSTPLFKPLHGLGTIISGAEFHGDDEDMSTARAIQRGLGNFKPASSLVGSPPSAPSLLAQAEAEQEAEWIIKFDELELGRRIGGGSYGEVQRAQWRHTDVAVKRMTNCTESHMEDFKQEVSLMARLKHPNVVQFLGACVDLPNLSIVTQFMPRGSLFNLLHKSQVKLDDKQKLWMALDCAKGMHYLHSCKPPIVHGDVSSKNMLVDRDFSIRVADFGMSRQKRKEKLSASKAAGTAEWTAPEVLRGLPYSEKADVFSFGVILQELMTQQVPWEELSAFQVSTAVGWNNERLEIPEDIDSHLADLIRQCFEGEPEKRPNFEQIIISLRKIRSSLLSKTAESEPQAKKEKVEPEAEKPAKLPQRSASEADWSRPQGSGRQTSAKGSRRRTSEENARHFRQTQLQNQAEAELKAKQGQLERSQSLESRRTF